MRLGNQRFNLADLVHRERHTSYLLHNSRRVSHECCASRQYCSDRNDYHSRAEEQSYLSISSKDE